MTAKKQHLKIAARRIIPRDTGPVALADLIRQACETYVASPCAPNDTNKGAFLAGAGFVMKILVEIDVPWMVRNIVDDAAESVLNEVLELRS